MNTQQILAECEAVTQNIKAVRGANYFELVALVGTGKIIADIIQELLPANDCRLTSMLTILAKNTVFTVQLYNELYKTKITLKELVIDVKSISSAVDSALR